MWGSINVQLCLKPHAVAAAAAAATALHIALVGTQG